MGGDLGDVAAAHEAALRLIEQQIGKVVKRSSLYATQPWGVERTDEFINSVVLVESELPPLEILNALLEIERKLGRIREGERYAPRIIDLDILYCDDLICESKALQLPHPRIAERRFVLVPMNEIAAEFIDPKLGKSITTLLAETKDLGAVRKMECATTI